MGSKRKGKRKGKKIDKSITLANRMIDNYFHPYFHKDKSFIIADTAMHFIVEQDPAKSFKKFVRYSLFKLIE